MCSSLQFKRAKKIVCVVNHQGEAFLIQANKVGVICLFVLISIEQPLYFKKNRACNIIDYAITLGKIVCVCVGGGATPQSYSLGAAPWMRLEDNIM